MTIVPPVLERTPLNIAAATLAQRCIDSADAQLESFLLVRPIVARAIEIAPDVPTRLAEVAVDAGASQALVARADLSESAIGAALKCALTRPTPIDWGQVITRNQSLAIFLSSSRWRRTTIRALRPWIADLRRLRSAGRVVELEEGPVGVALLGLIADDNTPHAEQVWALEASVNSKDIDLCALMWIHDIPDAVLRQALPGRVQASRLPSLLTQMAVLADPAWIRTLQPTLNAFPKEQCLLPLNAMRWLPPHDRTRKAHVLLEEFIMPHTAMCQTFVNENILSAPEMAPLRSRDVLVRLSAQPGIDPRRRDDLLQWLADSF